MSQAVIDRSAWRDKRQVKRALRRQSAVARVSVPIPAAIQERDPIAAGAKQSSGTIQLVVFLIAAVILHGGILMLFFGASSAVSAFEKIEMAIVQPPPPPPPPPPVEPPPPEPEVEKPINKPKGAEPPPPDPIDKPPEPPPEPPKTPARRIVGLSLESTVGGGDGSGPSFAVGNTRMGQTEKTAADAKDVKELPKDPNPPPPPTTNRVATRVPTGGSGPTIVKPKPIGAPLKPEYPALLKSQDIEADVVVEAIVGIDGKVKSVKILSPAPQAAFNEAAKVTALQQLYTPASKDGQPIEWTLTYTVRFRLSD